MRGACSLPFGLAAWGLGSISCRPVAQVAASLWVSLLPALGSDLADLSSYAFVCPRWQPVWDLNFSAQPQERLPLALLTTHLHPHPSKVTRLGALLCTALMKPVSFSTPSHCSSVKFSCIS